MHYLSARLLKTLLLEQEITCFFILNNLTFHIIMSHESANNTNKHQVSKSIFLKDKRGKKEITFEN